jgi:pimeloyl-ACP methyl ester carboxylesterase
VDRAPIAAPPFHQLVLTTADGVDLAAVRVGGGAHGVVLIHDARGDLCSWWQFAQRLADEGFHVLAFDLRCYGFSECGRAGDYVADTVAAVGALRRAGATRVALVGTSLGAAVAIVAAARHDAGVTGVVALSLTRSDAALTGGPDGRGPYTVTDAGTRTDAAPRTVTDATARLRVPLLFCLADADGEAMSPASVAALAAPTPTADRRVLTVPGPAHGPELVADAPHSLSRQVTAFLRAHT